MIQKTHGQWYRWSVNAAIVITAAALGIFALLLANRMSATNAKYEQQKTVNSRLNSSTGKLTCALVQIIQQSSDDLRNPRSASFQLYVRLGFTPAQVADIAKTAEQQSRREIASLPAHQQCPVKESS